MNNSLLNKKSCEACIHYEECFYGQEDAIITTATDPVNANDCQDYEEE
jgi:hypothetical protein